MKKIMVITGRKIPVPGETISGGRFLFAACAFALASFACVAAPDMGFVDLTKPAAVRIDDAPAGDAVSIGADGRVRVKRETPFSWITLTWEANLGAGTKVLGGEWERTYGDSEWHCLSRPEAERPRQGAMPWYFLVTDGARTDGYGVETQPNVFASWHATTGGVRLVLDCRAGSNPVRLGARTLEACRLVSRRGESGESAFAAGRAFCRLMCPKPRLPSEPVYGYNDWYCAYGRNTATNFLADAAFVCSLVKGEKERPFLVVDDGWQRGTGASKAEAAGRRWTGVNRRWGMPMDEVARRIRAMDAHPGLWYRPFLPDAGRGEVPTDPSDPALPARMREELRRFVAWGYELVKIDFITFDWCGKWGFELGDSPVVRSLPKWRDETRTTAEVVRGLYAAMREAVGEEVHLIGCNAIDHFAAGLFDLQRTGDDTSGRDWSRTRKMGPNTLGVRSIHNGTFYLVDADCFGLAGAGMIPWSLNEQWLDLVAASGTALFVSWRRQLTTPESRAALERALRRAAKPQPTGEPLDWLETPRPAHWRFGNEMRAFNWDGVAVRVSPRTIPLEKDVDVLVIGGGTNAVAAALAAKAEGASVFLAAPRAALGDGLADTLRCEGRPLRLKHDLDRELLKGEVDFMTGLTVTDLLVDRAGKPAGAVFASRAGRAAVKAGAVVDASEFGTWSRLAGSPRAAASGPVEFGRIVISENRPAAEGLKVEELPRTFRQKTGIASAKGAVHTARAFLCRMTLPVRANDWASYAAAEQRARDLTWTPGEFDGAERIFPLADPVLPGAEEGRLAARRAKARGTVGEVRVASGKASGAAVCGGYEVRELATGFRPFARGIPRVEAPESDLKVLGEYDTVVVGGGTSGAPAAIAAGRAGARTLLVEYVYGLGGVSTVGQIGKYWYGNRCGFTAEVEAGVKGMHALVYNLAKGEWMRRECRKAGVEIWFGTAGTGAVLKDGRVAGVVVATPCGSGVVLAKNVIDATGNADIAAAAGAETEYLGDGLFALQGAGQATHLLGRSFNNTDWGFVNESDPYDVWLFGLRTRLGGGYDDKRLVPNGWNFAPLPGARERRRVKGAYAVTSLDVALRRTFPDTIVCAQSNFDSHGPSVDDLCLLSERTDSDHRVTYFANVPYRSILPVRLDGIAVVGLAMGAHRDALPIMRMQPDQYNLGYASGLAAAQAARRGTTFRDICVRDLQRELVKAKVIPQEALDWTDSLPVPDAEWTEAVRSCGDDYRGIPVVLSRPEAAVPALEKAYAGESSPRRRLVYASILGVLGSSVGARTLADWFAGKGPEFADNPKLGFGRRLSDGETFLVALGRTREPCALDALEAAAAKIDAKSSETFVRAVSMAFVGYARPDGAAALEAALARPGVAGHSASAVAELPPGGGYCPKPETDLCQRELGLARALVACGDPHGKGREIFARYAQDPRGVFALYARRILARLKPACGFQTRRDAFKTSPL